MHLPVNTLLQGGKYRIVRFISSGGFGCTYEAEHVMLEERVAIKEFFVGDFCNRDETSGHVTVATQKKRGLIAKLQRKFIEEARSLRRLHHPGIVSVSDVFEENGTAYYVMDYIEGRSLGEIVNKEGPLSEDRAVRYIRQVAEALQYVHENNRLHLDIKPGNIMIDCSDDAILIDFGVSKQYDEESGENTSTLLGKTPGYASLEQMGNDVVKFTPATDIYALGATFYKLLTGVTPLTATSLASGEELEPLPPQVSGANRGAVSAAMSINKNKRPQTVGAFLQLLDACGTVGEEGEGTVFDPESSGHAQSSKPVQSGKPKKTSSREGNGQGNKKSFPWGTLGWILAVAAGVISVVVLLSVMRSSGSKKYTPEPIVVESISMNKESLSLEEGKSAWLSVQYTPSNAADKTTEWTSTDEKVAQVDRSGKVEAVGVGTAKIIASCNKKEAFCNVTVTRASEPGDETGDPVVEPVVVESISMNKGSLSLKEGESAMLSVQYTPSDAADKTTEWRSTNEKVAQVDTSGKVTAVGVGTAEIKASCNGKEAFCKVTVVRAVESISMNKESLSLQEGASATLSVRYTPSNAADKTTEWRSTDEKVVQVDKSGKVTAVGVGTAKIIASCNKKEAFCNLTVIPKIEMVYVTGGTFMMGATSEQGSDAVSSESPDHKVKLSGYYIGKYEVTQDLWESVMGTNPSNRKGPDLPVERVSWNDVQEFIRKLNAMTGKKYRLPTEAEWEYAARGGNMSQGYKYSGSDDVESVAWYKGNSNGAMHPVGMKRPNELGIHDMSGNVWEWCSDWYGVYSDGSQTNPEGPSKGSYRVLRGGGWDSVAWICRVSYRGIIPPGNSSIGFRLAASSL